MKILFRIRFYSFLAIIVSLFCVHKLNAQDKITVNSPDNKIIVSFFLKKLSVHSFGGNSPDAPFYEVLFEERPVILPSRLGFIIGGAPELSSCFNIKNHSIISKESSWKPIYGERNSYPDNYNELTIQLEEYIPPHRQLVIRFRAYNEGIALSYGFPSIKKMKF